MNDRVVLQSVLSDLHSKLNCPTSKRPSLTIYSYDPTSGEDETRISSKKNKFSVAVLFWRSAVE